MKIPALVIIAAAIITAMVQAATYEVLVVGIAAEGDRSKIVQFKNDAHRFNELHRQGFAAAKPYFNVLSMTNGQVYFVFGFKGEVQGIRRHNYPRTEKNLRGLKQDGALKYPNMHWVPVEEIRRNLAVP